MARFWSLQLRPVLVVWLLLTVPVVCQHETAALILGAISTHAQSLSGDPNPRGSAHVGHVAPHHVAHAPAPNTVDLALPGDWAADAAARFAADPSDFILAAMPRPLSDMRWCAHVPSEHPQFLPAGQGVVALRPLDSTPRPDWYGHLLSLGIPLYPHEQYAHPPAPPPRRTV